MLHKLGTFSDTLLDRQIAALVAAINKPTILEPGAGIIMTTPDGTKHYEVKIDDAGAVTTALVSV